MAYVPPIGIAAPPFGIEETYRMYDEESNRNPALTYYASDSGGYYTGYVDMTDPNSTDSGNPFGTKAVPRKKIPVGLAEGHVIEVHNEVEWSGPSGEVKIDGIGTAAKPIFVRGVDMPRTERSMHVGYYGDAKYIICEGMSFKNFAVLARRIEDPAFVNSYICIRDCDFYGLTAGASVICAYENNDRDINYIVLYNSKIHDHGDWQYGGTEDADKGGLFIQNRASYVWVLDNEFYHLQGTGCGIGPQPQDFEVGDPEIPHHIFIGRNLIYQNNQTGLWTKTSRDSIFSQNVSWGHRKSKSSEGGGIGFQYDPQRLWYIFNLVYDNSLGIDMGGNYLGGNDEQYFIGNLIFNTTFESYYPDQSSGEGDLAQVNGQSDVHFAFNILDDGVKIGIYNKYYPCHIYMFNNVITNCQVTIDLNTAQQPTPDYSDFDYNVMYNSGHYKWDEDYSTLAAFVAGTDEADNCVEGDPLYTDPDNGDYTIQAGSPVLSVGISQAAQDMLDRFNTLYGIDISTYAKAPFVTGENYAGFGEYGGNGDGDGEITGGSIIMIEKRYTAIKPPFGVRLGRGHLLAQGLVGCWILNEGAGQLINDLSGYGHIGTLGGDTLWKGGKFGHALYFDGSGDYVNVPDNKLTVGDGTGYTVIVFLTPDMVGSYTERRPFGKYAYGASEYYCECSVNENGNAYIKIYSYQLDTSSAGPNLTWSSPVNFYPNGMQICYTVTNSGLTGGIISLYVNGILRDSDVLTGDIGSSSTPFRFGSSSTDNFAPLKGTISYVYVFNRALSASEIAELYYNPFGIFTSKLYFLSGIASGEEPPEEPPEPEPEYSWGDAGFLIGV